MIIVIRLLCPARFGDENFLSGVPFDHSGQLGSMLAATWLAHRTHHLHFLSARIFDMEMPQVFTAEHLKLFLNANGTVRSRFSNWFVSSHLVAAMLRPSGRHE